MDQLSDFFVVALRSGGNKLEKKDVMRIIWDNGMINSMAVCGEIIASALQGGGGEGKPQAQENE